MSDPGVLVSNLIQKHFPKFGTFRKLCTYSSVADSTYNSTTGVVTEVTQSTHSIYIIFDEFSFTRLTSPEMQRDESNIKEIDRKAIFPALDLSVTPKTGDKITDDAGTAWNVIGIAPDPKPAHHELHVRPISG